MMLRITVVSSIFLISACTATPTPDLNMHQLRAVNITEYDTSIVATFCGTEAFNALFEQELTPKIYPVLNHSKNYLDFKVGFIYEYSPNEESSRLEGIKLNNFFEYKECGFGKKYPYIYWFRFNVEKNLPYEKKHKKDYTKAYNEFKAQLTTSHHIELGVVKLPAFFGEVLVSEKTSLLKLNEEQYKMVLNGMNDSENNKNDIGSIE